MWYGSLMMFGSILGFLLFIALVFLIVWLVSQPSSISAAGKLAPLAIAEERYADGEISREEYERIKKNLL